MAAAFPMTLEQFAHALRQKERREGTIREYNRVVRRAMEAGSYFAPLKAARSRSSWLIAYSAMAAYADAAGLGDIRPHLKKLPPPRRPPTVRRPVPQDAWSAIVARLDRLPVPDREVLRVLLLSGLRIGDLLGIRRAQAERIVATGSAAIFEKGDREREWAPAEKVRAALGRLLGVPGWQRIQDLVARHPGTARNRVRRVLRRLCQDAGVRYYFPHLFRHAMSSALDERAKTIQEIAAVLGHASTRTTQRYIHISPRRQAGAADDVVEDLLGHGGR